MSAWPWFVWLGMAWLVTVFLFVWLHHRFWRRFGDDEHRDSAT